MQIRNRQKVLMFAALAAVVLFLGDKLVLGPALEFWKRQAARISELRQRTAAGQALLAREQVIRTRWEQMRRAALPSNPSATEQQVYQAVDAWAQDSRASVAGVVPQWRKETGIFSTYQCRVEASGGISSLSKFLFNLERDPMPVRVESIEIGTTDRQGQQLSVVLQFSALVANSAKQ